MYTHVSDGDYPRGGLHLATNIEESKLLDELMEGATNDGVNRKELQLKVNNFVDTLVGLQAATGNDMEMDPSTLRDWGMQTDFGRYNRITPGGIPYRVAPPGRPAAEPKANDDLARTVNRLRMSVPLLRYARADKHLRHLVLSTLIRMAAECGEVIAAPDGALI
jgi:hypothetical protein